MLDWNQLREEYIADESTSYRKLAEKYGVGIATICKRAKAEGWASQREQVKNKTIAKSIEKLSSNRAAAVGKYDKMVGSMVNKLERAIEAVDPKDTTAIRRLTASLCDIRELLGVKSEADSREQEARIANLRKQADKEDDTASEIEITFAAGPEEWNE